MWFETGETNTYYLSRNLVGIALFREVASNQIGMRVIETAEELKKNGVSDKFFAVIWVRQPSEELRNMFNGIHVPLYAKFSLKEWGFKF